MEDSIPQGRPKKVRLPPTSLSGSLRVDGEKLTDLLTREYASDARRFLDFPPNDEIETVPRFHIRREKKGFRLYIAVVDADISQPGFGCHSWMTGLVNLVADCLDEDSVELEEENAWGQRFLWQLAKDGEIVITPYVQVVQTEWDRLNEKESPLSLEFRADIEKIITQTVPEAYLQRKWTDPVIDPDGLFCADFCAKVDDRLLLMFVVSSKEDARLVPMKVRFWRSLPKYQSELVIFSHDAFITEKEFTALRAAVNCSFYSEANTQDRFPGYFNGFCARARGI